MGYGIYHSTQPYWTLPMKQPHSQITIKMNCCCRPSGGEIVVSGAVAKGNKDFSSAAVNVAHQKPIPTHEKNVRGHTSHISQPRKFNN